MGAGIPPPLLLLLSLKLEMHRSVEPERLPLPAGFFYIYFICGLRFPTIVHLYVCKFVMMQHKRFHEHRSSGCIASNRILQGCSITISMARAHIMLSINYALEGLA